MSKETKANAKHGDKQLYSISHFKAVPLVMKITFLSSMQETAF